MTTRLQTDTERDAAHRKEQLPGEFEHMTNVFVTAGKVCQRGTRRSLHLLTTRVKRF